MRSIRNRAILKVISASIVFASRAAFAQSDAPSSPTDSSPTTLAPIASTSIASQPVAPTPAPIVTIPIAQPITPIAPPPPPHRNDYEGMAAPPTNAGTTEFTTRVHPGMELFAQYAYRVTNAQNGTSSWFHDFDITRAHGSLDGEYDGVRGRLLIEAVRSASNGALVGVAGDSLVFRAREAYAGYLWHDLVDVTAGIIPTLTIGELDGTWRMRAITASPLEANNLESPADVGASARLLFPKRYGWAAAAWYNGEGYTEPELNRGKTFEGAVEFHPMPEGALLPLAIFASYENGSTGTELARANRFTGALFWQGAHLRVGVDYIAAWGINDVGSENGSVVDAFVRAEPVDRVLLGARVEYFQHTSPTSATDAITSLFGTVGYRIADPLEAFLAITRSISTTQAESETPGFNFWELRAVTHIVF
jgi:hypothetical protein